MGCGLDFATGSEYPALTGFDVDVEIGIEENVGGRKKSVDKGFERRCQF